MTFFQLPAWRVLREELAQLQRAHKALTAQRDELAERLQALEIEHQRIVIDAGALAVQRDEGAELLKTLEVQRHCMAIEAATLVAQRDQFAQRLKALEIGHQRTITEARTFAVQRGELTERIKAAEAEQKRVAAESAILASTRNELASRLQALEAENQIIATERAALTVQCDALAQRLKDVRAERQRLKDLQAERQRAIDPLEMSDIVHLHAGKNLFWFNTANVKEHDARFMIFTMGNCGTIWLAASLNLNEQIYCHMGVDHPIESLFRYQMHKDGPAMLLASRPEHYRHGGLPDYMGQILNSYGLNYEVPPRDRQGFATYHFDELEGLPGIDKYKALGSVHSFTVTDFSNRYKNNRRILGSRRVATLNMIRHPIPRLEAYINAFVAHHLPLYKPAIDQYIEQNLAECREIENRFHISMEDPRIRSFLFAFRIGHPIPWIANELRQFKFMKTLKLETLQCDADYFAKTVSILTGGRVTATKSYLDEVYKPENLSVGRVTVIGARTPDARDQWEKWSDWERGEFARVFRQNSIGEAYAEYDYDFSFVEGWRTQTS